MENKQSIDVVQRNKEEDSQHKDCHIYDIDAKPCQKLILTSNFIYNIDFRILESTPTAHNLSKYDHRYTQLVYTKDSRTFISGVTFPYHFFYEFLLQTGEFVEKPKLLHARHGHCLIEVGNNSIACIAGQFEVGLSHTYIKHCEIYDCKKEKWRSISDLNQAKAYLSAFYFEDRNTLYAVGGKISIKYKTNSIECISFGEGYQGKWRNINIKNSAYFSPCTSPACVPINTSEVLIIGGISRKTQYINKVVKYDVLKEEMIPTDMRLYEADSFPISQGCIESINNKVYLISAKMNLHIFDKKKWDVIRQFVQ